MQLLNDAGRVSAWGFGWDTWAASPVILVDGEGANWPDEDWAGKKVAPHETCAWRRL